MLAAVLNPSGNTFIQFLPSRIVNVIIMQLVKDEELCYCLFVPYNTYYTLNTFNISKSIKMIVSHIEGNVRVMSKRDTILPLPVVNMSV